jgi:hypothetical protein
MAVTIGTASFPRLTAQPFGYLASNTTKGQTARRWVISGLLTPTEWIALTGVYNTWRNTRIDDPDSVSSNTVGTTIALTANGPANQTWTNVPCWFSDAPSGDQAGAWISASVELVHAAEQLAVLLKQQQDTATVDPEDLPNFGTYTLGGVTLTLTKPVESYGATPAMELTAGGTHYITGPLTPYLVHDISGTTTKAGWDGIRAWYEAEIQTYPSAGEWFPISFPTASAERKIVGGVATDVWTVSIQLGQVK